MDAIFLEFEPFDPSPTSPSTLQRETRDEELNWLSFDWLEDQNAIRDTSSEMDISSESKGPLATEPTLLEEAPESPHLSVLTDPSPENIPEVGNLTMLSSINNVDTSVGYTLPFRHNHGKPPNRYSPDIEERRSRYPIANYISTEKLLEPLKTFADNLSACHIPTTI